MARLFSILVGFATLGAAASLRWQLLPTNSDQQFRGLSPVSAETAWVAGTNGTVLRTTDGGATWDSVGPVLSVEDAELQFRDIQAFSAEEAVILSIGEATDSRIYITPDGGKSWTQSFTNQDAAALYDCIAFDTPTHGMAMSDPVEGKFRLIETNDGGASWEIVSPDGMPAALDGEFGFAASGTCLTTAAGRWYLASGGVDPGRIFSSADGHDWAVNPSAIAGGAAAGVFSVQFRNARQGIAVGGDYTAPNITANISSWSEDGGLTWRASEAFPGGYRSGSSWLPGVCDTAVAVGPTGSDVTFDGGKTWWTFDTGYFDSVECLPEQAADWGYNDPSNGFVQYVNATDAQNQGMVKIINDKVFLGVDNITSISTSESGRKSIRLESKRTFDRGLLVADIEHMPGNQCGVWPAFWTFNFGEDPYGEIDIIEGAMHQRLNTISLHTCGSCQFQQNITSHRPDCDLHGDSDCMNPQNTDGCGVRGHADSYGDSFNARGGGVYALLLADDSIRIWHWPRKSIPEDITNGSPDPSSNSSSGWGLPMGDFQSFRGGCDVKKHFRNQTIVININFCGDDIGPDAWAEDGWCDAARYSDCKSFVAANPQAFSETYWLINSILLYQ